MYFSYASFVLLNSFVPSCVFGFYRQMLFMILSLQRVFKKASIFNPVLMVLSLSVRLIAAFESLDIAMTTCFRLKLLIASLLLFIVMYMYMYIIIGLLTPVFYSQFNVT